MADELRTEVEQVIEREDVKQALKQTSPTEPEDKPKAEAKDKLWLGTHFIILIALAAVRLVLQLSLFGYAERYPRVIELVQRLTLSAMGVVLLLAIAKLVDVYWIGRIDSAVSRYNLRRVASWRLCSS